MSDVLDDFLWLVRGLAVLVFGAFGLAFGGMWLHDAHPGIFFLVLIGGLPVVIAAWFALLMQAEEA